MVEDHLTGVQLAVQARAIVNATGVWSDEVRSLDGDGRKMLRPSKGIHVVVPSEQLGVQAAVLIPAPDEGRFLFIVPWLGRTIIGTTDTDYSGPLDEPEAESAEVAKLIEAAARSFPESDLSVADVISTFAGLRPLVRSEGGKTSDVSRKELTLESESGLISILGGKLTTYRLMAEKVVDLAVRRLEQNSADQQRRTTSSRTDYIGLPGSRRAEEHTDVVACDYAVKRETVTHLMRTYGANYRKVLDITRESTRRKEALVADLPYIEAEVVYAARFEMPVTVDDILSRRTRISLLTRDRGESCAQRITNLLVQP
jgi:glycerol-3-phosphate dehydrogenase